jgi:hypothetical protein
VHRPPPLLLLELCATHAPLAQLAGHEVRNCHCPALLQRSTELPLQVRAPGTHVEPPEELPEEPAGPPDELDAMPLPEEDVEPEAPTVASLPEELPWTPPQSHGPRPLPSDAQIWNPAQPPGPAHATDAPGTQLCALEASGGSMDVTEPPPHCAARRASEANASAAPAGRRRFPTILWCTLRAATVNGRGKV